MTAALLVRCILTLPAALWAISAAAQFTPVSDDFSTSGNLTGSIPDSGVGNWSGISGTSGSIQVANGAVSLSTSLSEATQLNFASSDLNTGTIYMGFDFTISSSGTIGTNDTIQSFAGFRTGTAGSGTYAIGFGAFRPSSAAGTFNSGLPSTTTSQIAVGIFGGSSLNASTSSLSYWTSTLNRGSSYRAVLGFDFGADTVSLWIDPPSSGATSITLSGTTMGARGIFLRQGNVSTGNVTFDDLTVSTNFDTAASISAVPEPATYAGLSGAIALLATVVVRRRKKSSALRAEDAVREAGRGSISPSA